MGLQTPRSPECWPRGPGLGGRSTASRTRCLDGPNPWVWQAACGGGGRGEGPGGTQTDWPQTWKKTNVHPGVYCIINVSRLSWPLPGPCTAQVSVLLIRESPPPPPYCLSEVTEGAKPLLCLVGLLEGVKPTHGGAVEEAGSPVLSEVREFNK